MMLDLVQSKLLEANHQTLKELAGQPITIRTKVVDSDVVFVLETPEASYTISAVAEEDSPWLDLQITKDLQT